jgi:hypothetical protein
VNILFLYPHPAEDRLVLYRRAARTLRDRFGHHVVFVYVGDHIQFDDGLPTEHFDSWVRKNRDVIARTSVRELEARFPASNLWRGIVTQRTLADYSYLGGSSSRARFSLDELEDYLKAVVMFYEDVIRRNGIQLAIAQAPDVIHAQMLYELALSLPFRAINQFYDPYWKRDGRYCIDQVTFSSSWLTKRYRALVQDYDRAVKPREAELRQIVQECIATDPRRVIGTQGWPTGIWGTIRSAIQGLRESRRHFSVYPLGIFEAYYKYSVWAKSKAWLTRLKNLVTRRLFVRWSTELPGRPFVFFGLHYQPEAVTLASAPVWSDMLAMVRMLSVSLPAGFQLVVKDHPIIGGLRSAAFYRAVTDLPNVVLLPESFPTTPLIEKADLVCTLNGTVGLQALLRGKLLLLFGRIYYDCIDGILRPPANLIDLPILLKDVLINRKVPDEQTRLRGLLAFTAAYREVIVSNEKMEYGETPEERGEGLAELIDHWIRVDLAETTEPTTAPRDPRSATKLAG